MSNTNAGGFISEHDQRIGLAIARALCGGEVDTGTRVDEQWILKFECAAFVELLKNPRLLTRIRHALATGKPLRKQACDKSKPFTPQIIAT